MAILHFNSKKLITLVTGSFCIFAALATAPTSPVEVATDKGTVEITPFNNNIFKISLYPEGKKATFPRPLAQAVEPSSSDLKISQSPTDIEISSPTTIVRVNRKSGKVDFFTNKRHLLIEETGRTLENSANQTISFIAPKGQNYYGAGERGHSLRLNGDSLVMYNRATYGYTASDPRISQMNITMPWFASDAGYGVLMDDYARASLQLSDTITYSTIGQKPLSYFFINGNGSLAGVTSEYTHLTGRMQMPPLWTLGYITSKYGYKSQDETLGVIDTLKTHDYPVDGIILDLYWYGTETDMGRLEWNKDKFPNPRKMLADLSKQGVKTVLISQPYLNKIGALDNYNMLAAEGLLMKDSTGKVIDATTWVGDAGMFDVSNPATRQWMWNRYKTLTDDGVEAWWGDLGEPEVHPDAMVHFNGESAPFYHNVYGNEWSRILHEGFKRDFPDRRIMMMMRGGTAGLQRYNVFPWTGDVSRSWGGLQAQVKLLLNSGLSGMAYMGSDVGGFVVDPDHPTDPELYVRWMQFGVFSPTLRTHAQDKPEPYHYPEVEALTRRLVKMRYEWLPYNYTLAYENVTQGLPLARPLNFRGDNPGEEYSNLPDEYLWGDNILVAPVMHPGMNSRKVTFPAGKWYNFNHPTQPLYQGGTTVTVDTPLEEVPLFVRAGSFIPQYLQPIENTSEYNPAILTIRYYPEDKETSYTLFDDNRLSPASIEKKEYRLTEFKGKSSDKNIDISIKSEGEYPDAPQTQLLTFEIENISKEPKTVTIKGLPGISKLSRATSPKAIRQYGWSYDTESHRLTIKLSWNFLPVELKIKK